MTMNVIVVDTALFSFRNVLVSAQVLKLRMFVRHFVGCISRERTTYRFMPMALLADDLKAFCFELQQVCLGLFARLLSFLLASLVRGHMLVKACAVPFNGHAAIFIYRSHATKQRVSCPAVYVELLSQGTE